MRELYIEKLKGTLVDFNHLEHVLDNTEHICTWQVEIRKRNDDPLECDELVLHVEKTDAFDETRLRRMISDRFSAELEVHPNAIVFRSTEELRDRQGIGAQLKEQRVVDHRPKMKPEHAVAVAGGVNDVRGNGSSSNERRGRNE